MTAPRRYNQIRWLLTPAGLDALEALEAASQPAEQGGEVRHRDYLHPPVPFVITPAGHAELDTREQEPAG